ncbi:hypothetical protein CQW49_07745 [Methylosinus trichosporium OB3b]|uniref:Uncharacterized protein n=1 Tax=Methylosinus trichosporium (strain ATCC 35070 / NCIMB 11131 / UNIQEM 75 / OB3b) TaxID=595536 RepID=A0A2D2CYI9_METT3|nr:hypothetical protein CQW49_07745 [Methylosinus trichosporium OB3b]OBS51818.1 hypothetical protein A8B73_14265 [Methylosinus sp. 3S-1]
MDDEENAMERKAARHILADRRAAVSEKRRNPGAEAPGRGRKRRWEFGAFGRGEEHAAKRGKP